MNPLIENKIAEFKNQFVESGGFMLARTQQPTDFLLDWYRTALTDVALEVIEEIEKGLPSKPNLHSKGYWQATSLYRVRLASLRTSLEGEKKL